MLYIFFKIQILSAKKIAVISIHDKNVPDCVISELDKDIPIILLSKQHGAADISTMSTAQNINSNHFGRDVEDAKALRVHVRKTNSVLQVIRSKNFPQNEDDQVNKSEQVDKNQYSKKLYADVEKKMNLKKV